MTNLNAAIIELSARQTKRVAPITVDRMDGALEIVGIPGSKFITYSIRNTETRKLVEFNHNGQLTTFIRRPLDQQIIASEIIMQVFDQLVNK